MAGPDDEWLINRWKFYQFMQSVHYKIAEKAIEHGLPVWALRAQAEARRAYVTAEQMQLGMFMVTEDINTFWRSLS